MAMDDKLTRILVAGAGGTLGQALLKDFLVRKREVVAVCRDKAEAATVERTLARHGGAGAGRIEICDLGVHADVLALARSCGRIDGVVNAAGAFRWARVEETSEQDFDLLFNSNLKSTWNLLRAFLPGMRERGYGRMVFVSSKSTLAQGSPGLGLYLAAKAGINMLVQTAAEEVKDLDININAVLPSIIDNPQNRKDMPAENPAKWVTAEGLAELIGGIMGVHSRHVNGALIPVSGRV
jgi:NAD(P)-dependent dehydrogenase (short-subunit alcohol dehydrogenase family)